MRNKIKRKILIDSDVISHFIVTCEIIYLPKIVAPYEIVILDNVYIEATKISMRKLQVDNWIRLNCISIIPFPTDQDIKKEYFKIKKNNPLIGDGERACMAVAKYHKDIIASSNFKDIAKYCAENKIDYLGTLDLLVLAIEKDIFDEARCDAFIANAISINNARFPVNQIVDYIHRNIDFMK